MTLAWKTETGGRASLEPTKPRVAAAVVACNRPKDVAFLLDRLAAQSIALERVIVIDNGSDVETPLICSRNSVTYLRSEANIGGAGGFALAMLLAVTAGADYLWLWDDDGWPESDDCLERLLDFQKERSGAVVSPLVIDSDDETRCAFAFRMAGRSVTDRAFVSRSTVVEGAAHLFNGALIPAELFIVSAYRICASLSAATRWTTCCA